MKKQKAKLLSYAILAAFCTCLYALGIGSMMFSPLSAICFSLLYLVALGLLVWGIVRVVRHYHFTVPAKFKNNV